MSVTQNRKIVETSNIQLFIKNFIGEQNLKYTLMHSLSTENEIKKNTSTLTNCFLKQLNCYHNRTLISCKTKKPSFKKFEILQISEQNKKSKAKFFLLTISVSDVILN